MGLFTDIYNTVARFFRPQEGQEGDASKEVATNRLKLVLMQDRTNLTPKILEQMRGELVDLLSKYLEMDKELLELNFEQEGDQVALMLSIPVIRAKDEEEIEATLAAEAAQKAEEEVDEEESETESEDEETEEEEADDDESESEEDEEFEDEELVEEELETAEVEAEIEAKPKKKKAKKEAETEAKTENPGEVEGNK